MSLTNAEKQRRWRDRNVVVLTGDARTIAEQLIGMSDQKKLRKIAGFINDHLKHPDRTPLERSIALGRAGMASLNGPLSKTAAIAALRKRMASKDPSQVTASSATLKNNQSGLRY